MVASAHTKWWSVVRRTSGPSSLWKFPKVTGVLPMIQSTLVTGGSAHEVPVEPPFAACMSVCVVIGQEYGARAFELDLQRGRPVAVLLGRPVGVGRVVGVEEPDRSL